jgi:hypothetical protein
LIASLGLTLPIPQNDILFVDRANYTWGIFDEIGTTAFYAGKPEIGIGVCQKLLKEPHLPAEHRERVQNNYKIYVEHFQKIQKESEERQKQLSEKILKESNKTTLDMKPEAITVKL